ncbi:hypothetical protein NECID01_1041 [Nematocida sp. AWRm77]|nr:hypothetical protein NECID01_1041 [Nematocida sp. AWRm77]
MRHILDILRDEYTLSVQQTKDSSIAQILSVLGAFLLGGMLFYPKKSMQQYIEIKHVSIFFSNMVYVGCIMFGIVSPGMVFCMGGVSSEVFSLILKRLSPRNRVLAFTFSAVIMYGTYLLLLGSISLGASLLSGLGLGVWAVCMEYFLEMGHMVGYNLSCASLFGVGVVGLYKFFTERTRGILYLEEVSLVWVLALFLVFFIKDAKKLSKR